MYVLASLIIDKEKGYEDNISMSVLGVYKTKGSATKAVNEYINYFGGEVIDRYEDFDQYDNTIWVAELLREQSNGITNYVRLVITELN